MSRLNISTHRCTDHDTHSCTARAIDSAVEPVSLTLSKVTFGRSSSSLSLLICLGDRPLWSVCAVRTGHRHRSQWGQLLVECVHVCVSVNTECPSVKYVCLLSVPLPVQLTGNHIQDDDKLSHKRPEDNTKV